MDAHTIGGGRWIATGHIFIYLQLLDLLTTLVGLKLGAGEANPFVRVLMHAGPAMGILGSKAVALGLGAYCVHSGKHRLIQRVTYWYSLLVVWNLMVILATPGAGMR